jgi:UDP-glucose 4-epimerase
MIILAGGLGFIGSNIAIELLKLNYEVLIIDNLSNSDLSTLSNLYELCNSYSIDKNKLTFEQIDLTDYKKTYQKKY